MANGIILKCTDVCCCPSDPGFLYPASLAFESFIASSESSQRAPWSYGHGTHPRSIVG